MQSADKQGSLAEVQLKTENQFLQSKIESMEKDAKTHKQALDKLESELLAAEAAGQATKSAYEK